MLVVAAILALGGSACAAAGTATPPLSEAPVAGSATPAALAAGAALRTTTLTLDELRARKGHLGYDVREQPFVDPEQFDLGRMRLACGATVALPFAAGGEHKVYRSSLAVITEALAGEAHGAGAVVDAARADLVAGCAPVTTRWSGQAVTAAAEAPLELSGPAAVSTVAWSEAWLTASGGERHRYVVLAAAGERLTALELVVDIRLDPAQVRSLFELALAP